MASRTDNEKKLKENWEQIKETIKTEYNVSNIAYNTWISPLSFHHEENDVITALITGTNADNSLALEYINNKYKTFFQVTISEFMNHEYDIKFVLEKDIQPEEGKELSGHAEKGNIYNIKYENAHLNSKYTFDTFVVGNNNKLAQSAALAVAESPGKAYNPLYLYGGPGLGKTHLMHSIGHFILEQSPNMTVLYVTSEQFMNEVIQSIRSGNANMMTKLRDKYRTVDVLLIDDIQFIIGKESTQEEFFHTFNVLHEAGKQIVISSDKPPKDMETLDERFRSRFVSGLSADIGAPDYETRVAILQKNAENYYHKIDDSIIRYIAENVTSNIRELEGSLNKVIAYSKIRKEELTLELAKNALKDIISSEQNRDITPSYIIEVVAEHFSISPDDIMSKKRNSEFVLPRQICMYLCRTMTATSLEATAKLLCKKDHTTVIHGVNKITKEIETNSELASKIDIIKKKLNPI
ncbi:MAG: chromosomal replication initiator protein DnaA [Clostridium sp.]|nr:chromosomal replication initiator protein DnaA [Clostridium sp.]